MGRLFPDHFGFVIEAVTPITSRVHGPAGFIGGLVSWIGAGHSHRARSHAPFVTTGPSFAADRPYRRSS